MNQLGGSAKYLPGDDCFGRSWPYVCSDKLSFTLTVRVTFYLRTDVERLLYKYRKRVLDVKCNMSVSSKESTARHHIVILDARVAKDWFEAMEFQVLTGKTVAASHA